MLFGRTFLQSKQIGPAGWEYHWKVKSFITIYKAIPYADLQIGCWQVKY